MTKLQQQLIAEAKAKFGNITNIHESMKDNFTIDDTYIYYWFNTPDHSTHIVKSKL